METEIGSLSFSRKVKESFTIFTDQGNILITISNVEYNSKVKISVKAPKTIKILRNELIEVESGE